MLSSRIVFLGRPQNARCADPLLIPVSAVISRHERPCARRAPILAASTATCCLPGSFLLARAFRKPQLIAWNEGIDCRSPEKLAVLPFQRPPLALWNADARCYGDCRPKERKKVCATPVYQKAVCSVAASHRKLGAESSKFCPYQTISFGTRSQFELRTHGRGARPRVKAQKDSSSTSGYSRAEVGTYPSGPRFAQERH
jgi:hypothetical protein